MPFFVSSLAPPPLGKQIVFNDFGLLGSVFGTKLDPKTSPRGVREGPGSFPEGSLSQVGSEIPLGALSGPLLELSWGSLGILLGHFDPSWPALRLSRGRVGAVLARLGTVLRPSWAVLGPSWALLEPQWL